MDKLKQLETFVAVAQRASMSAAARAEGVAAAIVGRRMDALEARLGVKLMVRTTRRIHLTPEGSAFLENAESLLADWAAAENAVSASGQEARGVLRITAPAGFGRRHIAPLVPQFRQLHPRLVVSLDLSDRLVDVHQEGFDCAVRVGDLADSQLISQRLADNRRMCVASPQYLLQHGTPRHPHDLSRHHGLCLSSDNAQSRGWAFRIDGSLQRIKPRVALECTDGQVLHAWCLQHHGIAWRSAWEVGADLSQGLLVTVLDDFAAPPNGIFAVYAQRKHAPVRLRLWLDFLKAHFAAPGWDA